MEVTGSYAKYACDACRTRKVTCSRELPKCARCRDQGNIDCSYSRSGVLRRNRKRRVPGTAMPARVGQQDTASREHDTPWPPSQGTVVERLEKLTGTHHASFRDLAALMGEYHVAWQDTSAFDVLAQCSKPECGQFTEEERRAWIDVMIALFRREKMIDTKSIPHEAIDALAASSQPNQKCERAWWVMLYSIALKNNPVTEEVTHITNRLKGDLWSAFNDIRFVLQSSILNAEALIVMALSTEAFLSPQACWSLISKACTMLIDLGIGTHGQVDPVIKRKRDALFWRLSSKEKAMSLILSKTPIFQRELTKSMTLPSLEDLLSNCPRYPADGMPVLFEAHYEHQMALLSRIQIDAWHCLPGQESQSVPRVRKDLETWYTDAKKILEASAFAEKPLLGAQGLARMELMLQTLPFRFYHLDILLKVASKELGAQCVGPAQELLDLLPRLSELLANCEGLTICLLWEWLHYPMIAFGTLWKQIISRGVGEGEPSEKILELLGNVPKFLKIFEPRNAMAGKLQVIAEKIIYHAKKIYHSGLPPDHQEPENSINGIVSGEEVFSETQSESQFDIPSALTETTLDESLDGLASLPDNFLFDPTFDWFTWGDQLL